MPYPMMKHCEKQYLDLETHYLNLFNFVQSLLTITEGEDLDSDSQRLIHFDALCERINEGVERFSDFTEQVRVVKFKGESTTTPPNESARMIQLILNEREYGHVVDALEHLGNSFPDHKVSDEILQVSKDIQDLK